MNFPKNQTKSNEWTITRCPHGKHATWSGDHGAWIFSATTPCGHYGCDDGIPFTSPRARRHKISKAVAKELMPAITALNEIKEALSKRFNCTSAQLLATHIEVISELSIDQ